jgi:hypothetical protein
MKIEKVVISGLFSFPYGDAPGARMLSLAKGIAANSVLVEVHSMYFEHEKKPEQATGYINVEGNLIHYSGLVSNQTFEFSSNFLPRLKFRLWLIAYSAKLSESLVDKLSGESNEILFLYGRSYWFLNKVLKKIKKKGYKTKVVFDVVEPPTVSGRWSEILFHPFVIDSILVFRRLLGKFDALTFISNKLKEEFQQEVKRKMLLPSIKYGDILLDSSKFYEQDTLNIGYLGSLLEKDFPELLYLYIDAIFRKGIKFKLTLMGRFKNVSEGKFWFEKFKNSSFSNYITYIHNPSETEKSEAIYNIDFLVVFRKPEPLQEYTFPTRITEMLSYGKVVVVNSFGDFNLYFHNLDNCVIIDYNNLEDSINSIIKCQEIDLYKKVVHGGTVLLNGPFNAKIKAKELLQIFD